MSEHKHGTMDVRDHEKTFEGFTKWVMGVGAFCIGVVLFLAVFNS